MKLIRHSRWKSNKGLIAEPGEGYQKSLPVIIHKELVKMSWKELPILSKIYFTALLLMALIFAACSWFFPFENLLSLELLLFVMMGGVAARLNVKIPYVDSHFAVDTGFVFAIIMIYGIFPAICVEVLTKAIFTIPQINRKTAYRIAFNIASGIVSAFFAGLVYQITLAGIRSSAWGILLSMIFMVLTYFLTNTLTVALIISLTQKVKVIDIWWSNFAWTILGFMGSGSIACLLYFLNEQAQVLGIIMTIPIVAMAYFTHRLYLQVHEIPRA